MKAYKIAIDGPAASGKSSTAGLLAERLGFTHVISGNIYRAITYTLTERFGEIELQKDEQRKIVEDFKISMQDNKVFLDGKDVSAFLRGCLIDKHIASVAKEKYVREKVLLIQRDLISMEKHGIVMDGRDICSKVMPEADLKIFLTAKPETRARRRFLTESKESSYEELLDAIRIRDHIDSTRECGPLIKTPDAIIINNDDMTMEETANKVMEYFISRKCFN